MSYPTSGGPTIPHRATIRRRLANAIEAEEKVQDQQVKAALEAGAASAEEVAAQTGYAVTLARTVVTRLARRGEVPAGHPALGMKHSAERRFGPPR